MEVDRFCRARPLLAWKLARAGRGDACDHNGNDLVHALLFGSAAPPADVLKSIVLPVLIEHLGNEHTAKMLRSAVARDPHPQDVPLSLRVRCTSANVLPLRSAQTRGNPACNSPR